jgi:hypothetical protein
MKVVCVGEVGQPGPPVVVQVGSASAFDKNPRSKSPAGVQPPSEQLLPTFANFRQPTQVTHTVNL